MALVPVLSAVSPAGPVLLGLEGAGAGAGAGTLDLALAANFPVAQIQRTPNAAVNMSVCQ